MPHFQENTIRDIFSRLILQENGCVLWPGSHYRSTGRPRVCYQRKYRLVYKLLYEHFVGKVPDGLQLDHVCKNKACCNFAHLEAVTSQTNNLRSDGVSARHARKTHCPAGHPYSGDNLYVYDGQRRCRQCNKDGKKRLAWQKQQSKSEQTSPGTAATNL